MSRDGAYEQALNMVALAMSMNPEALKGLLRERPLLLAKIEKYHTALEAISMLCDAEGSSVGDMFEKNLQFAVKTARDVIAREERPRKQRVVTIVGGRDWNDASYDNLVIPPDIDIEAEKAARQKWYDEVYVPSLGTKPGGQIRGDVPFKSFVDWLLERGAKRFETEVFES